jgi:hypothetical protein
MTGMIVLVGCGKRKRERPCEAGEMYIGQLFRSHMALARQLPAREILILSAHYGVLELDRVIEPYDTTLRDLGRAGRCAWERRVAARVEALAKPRELVVVLAGAAYLEWSKRCARRVAAPLARMTLGERRAVIGSLLRGPRVVLGESEAAP